MITQIHQADIDQFATGSPFYLLMQQLQQPLPGIEAQLLMAPPSRDILLRNLKNDKPSRRAAVLIPLFYSGEELSTLLITRNIYPGVHSGQIAFPGGKHEPGDNGAEGTALREASEEVGILPDQVVVLGCLTDIYIPPSHFTVTPVVGMMGHLPHFQIDRHEVSAINTVTLRSLFDPRNKKNIPIETPAGKLDSPAYCIGDLVIWGATAMMISELEQVWLRCFVPGSQA